MEQKVRVGVIGAGDVAQVVHLPTLKLLSHLYSVQAICDVSQKTADHCASIYNIPVSTTNAEVLFNSPDIDAIILLTSDEYHAPYAIASLEAGKWVMVEKPLTLSLESAREILEAEKKAKDGARVFVGYMRRYAASLEAFKREVDTISPVRYARVRDIIGPNSYYINQSGTHPVKFFDDIPQEKSIDRNNRINKLMKQAWGLEENAISQEMKTYYSWLANLGSHGLSLMREALDSVPDQVVATRANGSWFTTMFDYTNKTEKAEPFVCLYETGVDNVPRFDSQIAIFGEHKSVSICYDTPFIKGLGITVEVDELDSNGDKVHRSIQSSYEDAYTRELKEFYECVKGTKPIKTTVEDAMEDLKVFKMILDKHPLGSEKK